MKPLFIFLLASTTVLAQDSLEFQMESRRRVEYDQREAQRQVRGVDENINYTDLVTNVSAYDQVANGAGRAWNSATSRSCGTHLQETIEAINHCPNVFTNQAFANPQLAGDMQNFEEELIYLEAAHRTHEFAQCQRKLFDRYPTVQSDFENQAWQQFQTIRGNVRTESSDISRARNLNNVAVSLMGGDPSVGAEARDAQDPEIVAAKQRISSFISRIPFGSRAEVKDALLPLFTQSNVSRAQVIAAYNGAIRTMSENNQKTLCYFQGGAGCALERVGYGSTAIAARGVMRTAPNGAVVYLVDDSLKASLRNSGQIENVIRSLPNMPNNLKDEYMCRQNQRYGVGPIVLEVAQIPLYFAGTYGLSRLAIRAGASAISASSITGRLASSGVQLASRLGVLGIDAVDFAYLPGTIRDNCLANQGDFGNFNGTCSAESEITQARSEASVTKCLTNVALGLGGALAGVAGDLTAGGRVRAVSTVVGDTDSTAAAIRARQLADREPGLSITVDRAERQASGAGGSGPASGRVTPQRNLGEGQITTRDAGRVLPLEGYPPGFREVTNADGVTYVYNAEGREFSRSVLGESRGVAGRVEREVDSLEKREKALKALEEYLAANPGHKILRNSDGSVTLKIGYLVRDDPTLLRYMVSAIKSGAITDIDAGQVVGEKVLHLLVRMQDIAPTTRPLKIQGQFPYFNLLYEERLNATATRGNSLTTTTSWSQQELDNFDNAMERLGLTNACKKLYGPDLSRCTGLSFTMDSRDSASVRWTAIFPR